MNIKKLIIVVPLILILYIVFWYSAEPNSFSGKSGPGVYIYGVK